MCEKCQELEKKIERYRRIAFSINDPLTIDRLNQLIKDRTREGQASSRSTTVKSLRRRSAGVREVTRSL